MQHLKELRKAKGLTQLELSKALDVSPSLVGMYEQGRREASKEILQRIADFFNVSTDYLLGRTDAPTPTETKPETHADDPVADIFDNPDIRGLAKRRFDEKKTPEETAQLKAEAKEMLHFIFRNRKASQNDNK